MCSTCEKLLGPEISLERLSFLQMDASHESCELIDQYERCELIDQYERCELIG